MIAVAQGVIRALRPVARLVSPASFCCVILCCALLGCGGNTRAPVEDRRAGGSSGAQQYTVQRGDTLYSIAFRYGLDYRRVAAANGLSSPYTIYPGQKVQLREAEPRSSSGTAASSTKTRSSASASPAPAKTTASTKTTPSSAKTSAGSGTSKTKTSKTKSSASSGAVSGARPDLRWPSSGRVIRGYSASVHKGIDIDGKEGDPIYAVAAGKVVYAGTGIVGFGELLIVKHSEAYLSAYGHNSRLLVAEGDTVKAGQKIAEKGNTGTDIVKLHFEIRRDGKPVDPQKLLPRR